MKTLIIIDVQNDFLPGGSLAVPKGDEVISVINRIMDQFDHVLATQDWHPKGHISFSLWPEHCVQRSKGAEIAKELEKKRIEKVFQKGTDLNIDSYSAFFDNEEKKSTGLDTYLKKRHLADLYFAGLATDYCVLYSVLDALELGFKVWVIRDACRAIHDSEGAFRKMEQKGARIIRSDSF